ncbi:MAG: hypothetical protein JOY62_03575 [Acidobacteriaceae bacterium]|nr:hypothetical protein [Acidobacteriaceae bacterium]MBV9779031.1 hypothetical protein [Acidobacteriaceae bacterium]
MNMSFFRICTTLTLGLAASMLPAQERRGLEGVWEVNVTVTNCHGTIIRTVHSLQLFHPDGSVIETSNLASRGTSEGTWRLCGGRTYDATYWFFRYPPPEGPFASFATVKDTITLDSDDDHFTSSGTVEDHEANGTTTTACFTHSATRLTELGESPGDPR